MISSYNDAGPASTRALKHEIQVLRSLNEQANERVEELVASNAELGAMYNAVTVKMADLDARVTTLEQNKQLVQHEPEPSRSGYEDDVHGSVVKREPEEMHSDFLSGSRENQEAYAPVKAESDSDDDHTSAADGIHHLPVFNPCAIVAQGLDGHGFDPRVFIDRKDLALFTTMKVRSAGVLRDNAGKKFGKLWSYLGKALSQPQLGDHIWMSDRDNSLWRYPNDRSLIISPSHQYIKDSNTFRPFNLDDVSLPHVGVTRELFHIVDNGIRYCGTYRCVGVSTMFLREFKVYAKERRHSGYLWQTIVRRTTSGEIVNTRKTVRRMYHNDQFRVVCHGLERVGYNDQLDLAMEAFQRQCKDEKREARKRGAEDVVPTSSKRQHRM